MFCSNCGAEIDFDDNYCFSCGAKNKRAKSVIVSEKSDSEQADKAVINQISVETPISNSVSSLWNKGTEKEWLEALEHYDKMIMSRGEKAQQIEDYLNNVRTEEIESLSLEQFYDFLYDKYFAWKFTNNRYLTINRKHLERYKKENRMSDLDDIKSKLFSINRADIKSTLKLVVKIHGLGTAGASGLLAILFPEDFGTIDQFVVISLRKIEGMCKREELSRMNPSSLTLNDGVVLINIFREKAKELNFKFNTDFWTPRKIDMVLWSFNR